MSLSLSTLNWSAYGLQFVLCAVFSVIAAAVEPTSPAAATVLCGICVLTSITLTILAFVNITHVFKKFSAAKQLSLTTSTMAGLVLGVSAIAFIIAMWDATNFDGIPPASSGFDLWWTYCVSNTIGFFFTSGRVTASGATALGVVPNVLAIICGAIMLTFFMGVILAKVAQNAASPSTELLAYPVRNTRYTAEELRKRRPAHELRIHRK